MVAALDIFMKSYMGFEIEACIGGVLDEILNVTRSKVCIRGHESTHEWECLIIKGS